jgi:hypothetical protein
MCCNDEFLAIKHVHFIEIAMEPSGVPLPISVEKPKESGDHTENCM